MRLVAWLLWLRRNAAGPWRLYIDLLPRVGAALRLGACSYVKSWQSPGAMGLREPHLAACLTFVLTWSQTCLS